MDHTKFRHLYPFKSHFIKLRGFNYHFIDEGQGKPVLMIHGNPTWSFYYRELEKALSPQFRTIVPDHLGCGFSDKPDSSLYGYSLVDRVNDIESLIDKLKLKGKVNIIAHDWGGMIGMANRAQ